MTNQTFAERLIKVHSPEPLEGHTVVVLERVGDEGEKLHSLIRPGEDRARGSLLQRVMGSARFFAFAVDTAPELSVDFPAVVTLADHVSQFDLSIRIQFRVENASALVAMRNHDPLARIREKVAQVMVDEVGTLEWDDVWKDFRAAARRLVERNLAALDTFAGHYGVTVLDVGVSELLPEQVTATLRSRRKAEADAREAAIQARLEIERLAEEERVAKARAETENRQREAEVARIAAEEKVELERQASALRIREKQLMANEITLIAAEERVARAKQESALRLQQAEMLGSDMARVHADEKLAIARQESELRLRRLEMEAKLEMRDVADEYAAWDTNNQVRSTLAGAFMRAVQQVAAGIETPDEMFEALRIKDRLLAALAGADMHAGSLDRGTLAALASGTAPAAELQGQSGRLAALLGEVVTATHDVGMATQRRELRAALLHLAAASLAENGSRPAAHAERARTLIGAMELAPGSDKLERLRDLSDPQHVRQALD
jgi:hypothetical protein